MKVSDARRAAYTPGARGSKLTGSTTAVLRGLLLGGKNSRFNGEEYVARPRQASGSQAKAAPLPSLPFNSSLPTYSYVRQFFTTKNKERQACRPRKMSDENYGVGTQTACRHF